MPFIRLTRPDDTEVHLNTDEILQFDPVPPGGVLAGPLDKGTRVTFKNRSHQDVKELCSEVAKLIDAAT